MVTYKESCRQRIAMDTTDHVDDEKTPGRTNDTLCHLEDMGGIQVTLT